VDGQGTQIASLGENSRLLIDETLLSEVASEDTTVRDAFAMQTALEQGEALPDDPTAVGEEPPAAAGDDPFQSDGPGYHGGDQSAGDVDPRGLGIDPPSNPEDILLAKSSVADLAVEAEGPPPPGLFIVGSDPLSDQGEPGSDEYPTEGPGQPFENDVPGSTTEHTVYPEGGPESAAIIGGAGADTLVGDVGGYSLNTNYIVVMDVSQSMVAGGRTRLADLKTATIDMIDSVYSKVENSTNGYVKFNLMTFDDNANPRAEPAWISFQKVGDTVIVQDSIGDQNSGGMEDIRAWINGLTTFLGGTNYQDAFDKAGTLVSPSGENHVIFITDGIPNLSQPYDTSLTALELKVDSIRAVGIQMSASSKAVLDDVDNVDPVNGAANAENANELIDHLNDAIPHINVDATGSDQLTGDEGNDLIFGDVLNTDGVSEDLAASRPELDLSSIENLEDGLGWEVFARLEANTDWERADTIQYIQDNHQALAGETKGADGDGREGGHDQIDGGAGDDIIYGQEGNDTITGGSGDDTISGGSGTDTIDGGAGTDTLLVTEATLDFSNLSDTLSSMEAIRLGDDGEAQSITNLTADMVLDMSDTDSLAISGGDDGDTLVLDSSWTQSVTNPDTYEAQTTGLNPTTVSIVVSDVNVNLNGTVYDDQGNAVTP